MSDRLAVFNRGRIEQVGTPGRGLRAAGHRVRRRVRGDVERAGGRGGRARSPATRTRSRSGPEKIAMVEPDAEVPDGRLHGDRARPRGRLPGCGDPVHRHAGRRGRARRDAAEPDDVVDGGAAGARQGRAPGVGSQEQPPGRRGRRFGRRVGRTQRRRMHEGRVPNVARRARGAWPSWRPRAATTRPRRRRHRWDDRAGRDRTARSARREGALELIAWHGYTEDGTTEGGRGLRLGHAVRGRDRVRRERDVRRHLGRDGHVDAPGRRQRVRRRLRIGRREQPADRRPGRRRDRPGPVPGVRRT